MFAQEPALPVTTIRNRPMSKSAISPEPLRPATPEMEALRSGGFDSWFRIGYLRPAGESALSEKWYRDLQLALQSDPEFAAFIRDGYISGVALRPCDGPVDMLQRMLQTELDMAFCPAMVYARERLQRDNRSRYHVLFQVRWRDDPSDSHGGPYVRHRGVLFVRRGSDLDLDPKGLGRQEIERLLSNRILAVSSSYDAAGYFYVRKKLWDEYRSAPKEFLSCGSPQEVVKAVVSGLVEVGGVEERALREAFDTLPSDLRLHADLDATGSNDCVRTISYTQWAPADPVVIRDYYFDSPTTPTREAIGASIGRVAASAVKRFYNYAPENAPLLEQPRAEADLAYEALVNDVELTRGYGW